jgi:hypothetical protein
MRTARRLELGIIVIPTDYRLAETRMAGVGPTCRGFSSRSECLSLSHSSRAFFPNCSWVSGYSERTLFGMPS